MKRSISIVSALSLLAVILCASACNTTKGFGTDVEKVGSSIEGSADKHGAK